MEQVDRKGRAVRTGQRQPGREASQAVEEWYDWGLLPGPAWPWKKDSSNSISFCLPKGKAPGTLSGIACHRNLMVAVGNSDSHL